MRRRINKPIGSKISTSKQFKRFDSPEHLAYAAETCEANEWQGIKPDYRPTAGNPTKPQTFEQMKTRNTVAAASEFVNRRQVSRPAIAGPVQ
jgi:hypothetical protein